MVSGDLIFDRTENNDKYVPLRAANPRVIFLKFKTQVVLVWICFECTLPYGTNPQRLYI